MYCPVGWGCRIHWLLFCREVRPPNECPAYDPKQSDGEVPVMLELREMRSTPSLASLPGPLWSEVVAPNKGPIYGLNRTNCILMLNWIIWIRTVWLNWIAWTFFTIKLYLHLKMLNWIVFETLLTLNWIV